MCKFQSYTVFEKLGFISERWYNVTVLGKMGHPAKTPDMPFLVPFASTEFCAHSSHIFVLFMRQSAETQWPQIFRHPGNSELEYGSEEIFRIR